MREDYIEPPENINSLPDGVPTTIPAGFYLCQFAKNCTMRTSQFDPSQHYYELPLKVKDDGGNTFEFSFNFQPKSSIYISILKLAGSEELPSGVVKAPKNSIIGKFFMAEITRRQAKNDKTRLVNDIIKVWAYEPKKAANKRVAEETEINKEEFPIEDEEEPAF